MVIQHNICAMNANRILKNTTRVQNGMVEKLSSGYKINRAADDAAGLSISEKMRKQIRGLARGMENMEDGISLLQVADGALEEVQEMLHRMNELSVQAANGTNADSDRKYLQQEIDQLKIEIDRIGETTSFNELKLFRHFQEKKGVGGSSDSFSLHVQGMPADQNIREYHIAADETNGVTVNQTTIIGWDDIKEQTTGYDLMTQVKAGAYQFTYNGLDISFEVKDGDTLESLAKKLDGMDFRVDRQASGGKVSNITLAKQSGLSMQYVYSGDDYVDINKNASCEITANDNGIIITNKNNGASTVLDFYNDYYQNNPVYDDIFQDGTANHIDFAFFDSQYLISVDLEPGWTKQDVIDAINGMTYESNTTGDIGEPLVMLNTVNKNGLIGKGVKSNFSKDFFESRYGLDITELDRSVNWLTGEIKHDKIELFYQNGFPTTTLSLIDVTTQPDPVNNQIVKYTYKYADPTDANNWMELSLIINQNLFPPSEINDFLDANSIQSLRGHSKYHFSNIQLPQSQPVNLTVHKSEGGNADGMGDMGIRIQCSAEADDFLIIRIGEMNAKQLGIHSLSAETQELATKGIQIVSQAIEKISAQRAKIGAYQNRLEHAVQINENTVENTQYAESMIRDADISEFMVEYANQQVLLSASQSMLAAANQKNEMVIKLLQ